MQISISALTAPVRSEKAFSQFIVKKFAAWQNPLQIVIEASKHSFEKDRSVNMALSIVDYAKRINECLDSMREDLKFGIKFIKRSWFDDSYKNLNKWIEANREYIESDIKDFYREWTDDGELPSKSDIEGYSGAMVAELVYATYDASKAILAFLNEYPKFMSQVFATLNSTFSVDIQESLDEVEILYHATAFKTEILKEGFQSEAPMNRRGLGVYGKQYGISFTYDLYVAKEISRCLKEALLIVEGKLSYHQVLDWFSRDKLNVQDAIDRVKREKAHATQVERTLYLYNYYLWINQHRYNPVFTYVENLANLFKTRRKEDIGVLRCHVKTEKIEHKPAEREIIAPASSVIKIENFI